MIIPFNMRDGILLGVGKGDPDWNYSAPFAYRSLKEIEDWIGDTVKITNRIKPVYNFKAE